MRILTEIGRPQDIVFFAPFFLTDNIMFLAKALGVVAWIASACFQYTFLNNALLLPKEMSFSVAVVSLTCPFFSFWGELTYNMYIIAVMLFWLGWSMTATRLNNVLQKQDHFFYRLTIIIVFVASFELNSNIAHLYSVALLVIIVRLKLTNFESFKTQTSTVLRRFGELALLPVLYWILKTQFTPTKGYWLSYNKVDFSLKAFFEGYTLFVQHLPLYLAGLVLQALLPAGVIVLLLILVAFIWFQQIKLFFLNVTQTNMGRLLVGGVIFLFCSPFSYVAVGQLVVCDSWSARNTILINLPFALILISAVGLLIKHTLPSYPQTMLFVVGFTVTVGLVATNITTLRWQAFGVKQLAIQKALRDIISRDSKQSDVLRDAEIQSLGLPLNSINLRDYYQIPHTLSYYPPIVWTYLVAPTNAAPSIFVIETTSMMNDAITLDANGRESRSINLINLGPDDLFALKEATTLPYALRGIPNSGRTKTVAVLPGSLGNNGVEIGTTYLRKRLFDSHSVGQYVSSIVEIVELN